MIQKKGIHKKMYTLFLSMLLLAVSTLSACAPKPYVPREHLEQILSACETEGNPFPSDVLKVEFQHYSTPTPENNFFHHTVRFANITQQPVTVQILGFYDITLDKQHIIARGGGLQPSPDSPLTLEPGSGWIFDNTLTPLWEWDSYSDKDKDMMCNRAKKLYFEIILHNKTYYCILDFEKGKVISDPHDRT